ncbi:hypothetical protein F8M41_016668 [Gigaspora margarita]|uniref:Uncharacterized protein n=1 Tax=Gigaspora margarita TaxID=4874 RepID=A0A8H4AP81_GIGMA|nr:hypothetical protein F8M41_016668 [Gigaspora margarita]
MFVCPILEIVKIKIFDKTNDELHYNKGAEYASFVLLIVVKWYLRDYVRVRNEEAAGSIGREIVVVEKQIEPPKPAVISDIIG